MNALGKHYHRRKIQPVELILKCCMGFCEGNIVKYVDRWRAKDGLQDLIKARDYLQYLKEAPLYQRLFRELRIAFLLPVAEIMSVERYLRENEIAGAEAGVIRHIWHWNFGGARAELDSAGKWLHELILEAEQIETTLQPNITARQAEFALQIIAMAGGDFTPEAWEEAVNIAIDTEEAA